jgi:hypothetical protein
MTAIVSFPGPSGLVDQLELRKNLAGLIVRSSAGVPRAGVFPRSTAAIVTSTANTGPMTVNVAAFEAALVRENGPLFMQNDGTVSVSLAVAPVSNSRIDVIYARQNESAAPMSDGADTAVISAVTGTAAASPVKPSIPTGALELATVLVPTGVTASNSGSVVITQTAPFTATAGGVVLLRSQADEDAWAPGDGALGYRIDTDGLRVRRDGAWTAAGPRQYQAEVSGTFSTTLTSVASVSLPAGIWDIAGIIHIEHSTATNHWYRSQLWNNTAGTEIDQGQVYGQIGTLRFSNSTGKTIVLAAAATIQLRVRFDGAEGTQLLAGGRLRATEIGALL